MNPTTTDSGGAMPLHTTSSTEPQFKPGDPVYWHYTPRGGWGYTQRVYATVIKVNTKTIVIEARQTKPVEMMVTKRVSRANVHPRTENGGAS